MFFNIQHYKKSLTTSFDKFPEAKYVVIIEEDLEVSVDILTYFNQLLPVLENDESVYCISAWNDQVCSVDMVTSTGSSVVLKDIVGRKVNSHPQSHPSLLDSEALAREKAARTKVPPAKRDRRLWGRERGEC